MIQELTAAGSSKLDLNTNVTLPVFDKLGDCAVLSFRSLPQAAPPKKPTFHLPDVYVLAFAWSKEFLS